MAEEIFSKRYIQGWQKRYSGVAEEIFRSDRRDSGVTEEIFRGHRRDTQG